MMITQSHTAFSEDLTLPKGDWQEGHIREVFAIRFPQAPQLQCSLRTIAAVRCTTSPPSGSPRTAPPPPRPVVKASTGSWTQSLLHSPVNRQPRHHRGLPCLLQAHRAGPALLMAPVALAAVAARAAVIRVGITGAHIAFRVRGHQCQHRHHDQKLHPSILLILSILSRNFLPLPLAPTATGNGKYAAVLTAAHFFASCLRSGRR